MDKHLVEFPVGKSETTRKQLVLESSRRTHDLLVLYSLQRCKIFCTDYDSITLHLELIAAKKVLCVVLDLKIMAKLILSLVHFSSCHENTCLLRINF